MKDLARFSGAGTSPPANAPGAGERGEVRLVIDLIVSSVLMSMGMMMLSPMMISMPFKLMLFVLVDGWSLLMGSLASSFAMP